MEGPMPPTGTDRRALADSWKLRARQLERESYALYFACRDTRAPWYAKALAVGIVAYAFSPIDLIPDFIPVLGYLDELVLIPLGVMAVRSMMPPEVMAECRERASRLQDKPRNWIAAAVIVAIWVAAAIAATRWVASRLLQ
jgi:uncharacterized membrane protein YkvA (DUF1232 family)